MSEIKELIENAQARGTFSVLKAVQEIAYPEDSVLVITDSAGAYELHKLELAARQPLVSSDELNDLDEKIVALKDKIRKTSLTFHMRGVPRNVLESIEEICELELREKAKEAGVDYDPQSEEAVLKPLFEKIAVHIVAVENGTGEVDSHRWTGNEVKDLSGVLKDVEFYKLPSLMTDLTIASVYFEELTDADFLSKP